ncbi:MAG TPA: serine/threonine-protein kinase [Blastocatellia bacterium]|nr:serine/threonine-protein kinase [Blastocatellia bacterium]
MSSYDPNDTVRECVSCKRCYPSHLQFCRDCLVELRGIETVPYTINARYQLERVINHGGSGIVFSATNEAGQEVAIKLIRASAIADPRAQDRFRREAQIALDFKHPQIAAVFDFGMLPNACAYVVSEYVRGKSLREEMKRQGKFDVDDAIQIIAETCEALDAAHKVGLVHRDLKPECIILGPPSDQLYPNVKIVNFSLSKFASGQQHVPGATAKLQGQGQLPLRPTYLSPEQFRGEEADPRSDIYSLGGIAYEMLAGHPPFTAKRVGDFGAKLLNVKPPSLRALNPDVNIVIEAEILRALEKEPIDRQQRATEFRRELLNALHLN